VPLAAAPAGIPGAAMLPAIAVAAESIVAGTRHVVADVDRVRHRLHLCASAESARLVILMGPVCEPLRAVACDAARRMMAGLGTAEAAAALRPSALQRQRFALLLRVLDAWLAGASNREIGIAIVYPWLAGTHASTWKASGERRRVQRLVGEARDLAESGYRALLRP
jgi:hypothetical protein